MIVVVTLRTLPKIHDATKNLLKGYSGRLEYLVSISISPRGVLSPCLENNLGIMLAFVFKTDRRVTHRFGSSDLISTKCCFYL